MLAGGRSRRFGEDKLRAVVNGSTVISRVVRALSPLTPRILLSAPQHRLDELASMRLPELAPFPDEPEVWGPGPGGAIRRLVVAGPVTPLLIVPGDLPWIETGALRRFVSVAAESGSEVAVPVWASGETEHLVQWHPGSAGRPMYATDPRRDRRSARASELLRAAPRTLLVPVGMLDRLGRSFAHLTRPSDLGAPVLRGAVDPAAPLRCVVGEPKRLFREGREAEAREDRGAANRAFEREAQWYGRAGLPLLYRHAAADAAVPNP